MLSICTGSRLTSLHFCLPRARLHDASFSCFIKVKFHILIIFSLYFKNSKMREKHWYRHSHVLTSSVYLNLKIKKEILSKFSGTEHTVDSNQCSNSLSGADFKSEYLSILSFVWFCAFNEDLMWVSSVTGSNMDILTRVMTQQ